MRSKILVFTTIALLSLVLALGGCATDSSTPTQGEESSAPEDGADSTPEASETQPIKWDLQTPWPVGFQPHQECDAALQKINAASGGRLEMTLHPGGAIVPTNEILDAVNSGALAGEVSGISTQFGKFATAMFFDKYPAGPNAYEMYVWLYEAGGMDLWQELYDRNNINVHVVGVIGASQAESFGWFDEPVTSLDDFQGLKFRTQGTWGDVLTSLGASVVTIPGGEVYESAQRGVIDAFEFATPAVDLSAGFWEIKPVLMEPGIHAPTCIYDVIVNQDEWNALPNDLKLILELGCQAGASSVLTATDYDDMLAFKELEEKGIDIHQLPDNVIEEIVRVSNEMWDEMAADDPFFAEVLESQRDFLRNFRAMQDLKEPKGADLTWPQQ